MTRRHKKIHAFGSALVVIVIAGMLFVWYLTLASKNEWPSGQTTEEHR
jgi:hypothetical protein